MDGELTITAILLKNVFSLEPHSDMPSYSDRRDFEKYY